MAQFFGAKRWIYNHYLALQQERFLKKEKLLSFFDMGKDITQLKKQDETAWLKGMDDWCLKHSAEDISVSYQNFFNSITGKRKGPKSNTPSFKSKFSRQSYRTRDVRVDCENGIVTLPKIKNIKTKFSRSVNGKIKCATVSKNPDGKYYISILVEEDINLLPASGREVGIDLGIKDLMVLSNGVKFDNPKYILEKANRELKKQQKKLAKKTKGSNNRAKQKLKVAKAYANVTAIRKHYYHEISSYLVNNFDAIYLEDLNVKGMLKNRKLSRAIHDCSWSTLVSMISYKASWYGKTFHQIGRYVPSSKTCSCCDHKLDALKLSVREWVCPVCGTTHDRDLNAAINIKQFGQLDCYGKVLSSVEPIERESLIPLSLQKHSSKIERSSNVLEVGMGSKKSKRSKTRLDG